MKKTLLFVLLVICIKTIYAQGLIQNQLLKTDQQTPLPTCGTDYLMHYFDRQTGNYIEKSNEMMMNISHRAAERRNQRTTIDTIYEIPVVFHILYNEDEENLPDSVIHNQIEVMNKCYRMKLEDTTLRDIFNDIVADSKIQFKLADTDPDGNPTNGINRVYTEIEYFGGVLPYNMNQQAEIIQWQNDSLFPNYKRMSNPEKGGAEPWNTDKYFNIFVGDLRVFEPEFDNLEQILILGMGVPDFEANQWPQEMEEFFADWYQGIYMHYHALGGNNPVEFPSPYQALNGITTSGKIAAHEAGHYLGLRHIWGDGDCSLDDFIDDTPNAGAQSNWDCKKTKNTCTDDENDLPDMVENFMDYSSGSCMNSFTKGQIAVMHTIIDTYKPNLATKIYEENSISAETIKNFSIYPNPTSGEFTIETESKYDDVLIRIYNCQGTMVSEKKYDNLESIKVNITGTTGVYHIEVLTTNNTEHYSIVKQ